MKELKGYEGAINVQIKVSGKAIVQELIKIVHQAEQLDFSVKGIEVRGNELHLIVSVEDKDRGSLYDFVKQKSYNYAMNTFKCVS